MLKTELKTQLVFILFHLIGKKKLYWIHETFWIFWQRYFEYSAIKSELYMIDFCYFINFSVMLQTAFYPDNLEWFQVWVVKYFQRKVLFTQKMMFYFQGKLCFKHGTHLFGDCSMAELFGVSQFGQAYVILSSFISDYGLPHLQVRHCITLIETEIHLTIYLSGGSLSRMD